MKKFYTVVEVIGNGKPGRLYGASPLLWDRNIAESFDCRASAEDCARDQAGRHPGTRWDVLESVSSYTSMANVTKQDWKE